jgi:hypothetical protein
VEGAACARGGWVGGLSARLAPFAMTSVLLVMCRVTDFGARDVPRDLLMDDEACRVTARDVLRAAGAAGSGADGGCVRCAQGVDASCAFVLAPLQRE